MPGLLRRYRRCRDCWLLLGVHDRHGSDFEDAALSDHILPARAVREMVTGPLEFGLIAAEYLVAVTKGDEILVRTATEGDQTDQRESQPNFDSN